MGYFHVYTINFCQIVDEYDAMLEESAHIYRVSDGNHGIEINIASGQYVLIKTKKITVDCAFIQCQFRHFRDVRRGCHLYNVFIH